MPGILVEFDAVQSARAAAKAAGVEHGEILAGLLETWTRVFRTGVDCVMRDHMAGFFSGDLDRIIPALVAFGFLAPLPDGGWRVKGAADRILRGKAARRAGGLAAKKHLLPGGKPRSPSAPAERQPKASRAPTSAEPRLPADQHSAISIQHSAVEDPPRASRRRGPPPPLELVAVEPPAPPEPAEWRQLTDRLVQVFAAARGVAYSFTSRDAVALKRLRANATDEQIAATWDRALKHVGFPAVATIWELEKAWNHFSAPKQAAPGGVRHQRAETQNHGDDTPF